MLTQEQLNAAYDDALENDTCPVNPESRKTYDELSEMIEKYADILIEENFKWGYQMGYEAGRKSA